MTSAEPELPLVSQLRSQLESILLVVDTPVSIETLSHAVDARPEQILIELREIAAEFTARGSGIDLRETEEGWRFYTLPANSDAVEQFMLDGTRTRLSRAALETLAVIAYRQPVTRGQVSAVRGVNVDGVMRTLQLRGLIKEVDTPESGVARHYATTELFLELLGLNSLSELPELAPLLPDVDSIEDH
ncbi:SMC-Scp complex subunit ScpB [Corynebacterium poyangense]|uniref:SMC-Scp complex subunit ScpB n=1 Tax=Corynebacterium poyangense TaxID=2684405 RepID=A0A7H0SNQ6_9CORY|nr:SMC-Scp complex subunit ScpB [Corynebacterium poyangense]MBZ8177727.1 SMC-Scp complex subunit ScpB [Corynebacterium poyangense]QNQ90181.1 SMC-Scp complex subunit ScpB [Corynebacterium poyangense]